MKAFLGKQSLLSKAAALNNSASCLLQQSVLRRSFLTLHQQQ